MVPVLSLYKLENSVINGLSKFQEVYCKFYMLDLFALAESSLSTPATKTGFMKFVNKIPYMYSQSHERIAQAR